MVFTTPQILALSIFASYFLLILVLLYVILSSFQRHGHLQGKTRGVLVFGGLALASFGHTWYWMFRFMAWSFHTFESTVSHNGTRLPMMRLASWLAQTALFEQAWSAACTSPLNWWWSEQLCLFTAGGLTVFMFLHRDRVPHVWAYMLLGQVVAISVAWSLFNLALVLISPPTPAAKSNYSRLSPTLTIPVLLSLLMVSLAPYTTSSTFLPNLLAMHALLVLPLLPIPAATPPLISPRTTSFYTLIALLSLLLRTRTTLSVLSALYITSSPFFSLRYPSDLMFGLWNAPVMVYRRVWETLHSHPAQASIGWDVVWTSIVWLTWGAYQQRDAGDKWWSVRDVVFQALQAGVASVGVAAPMAFGRILRDDNRAERSVKAE